MAMGAKAWPLSTALQLSQGDRRVSWGCSRDLPHQAVKMPLLMSLSGEI